MKIIHTTKAQRNELLKCRNGVGFIAYKVNDNTTREVEFYIKNGIPCYLTNGQPLEFNIDEETE